MENFKLSLKSKIQEQIHVTHLKLKHFPYLEISGGIK